MGLDLPCLSCEILCNLVLPEPQYPEAQQQAQDAPGDQDEQPEEAAESVQPAKPAAGGGRGRGKGKGEGKGEGKGVLQGQREKKWQTHSPNQVLDKELCNPTLKRPSGLSWGPRADKR